MKIRNLTMRQMIVLLSSVMFGILFSCSSKEDVNQEEIAKGDEAVAWIKNQILDEKGNVAFTPSNEEGVYIFCTDDRNLAHSLCETLIRTEFQEKSYIYKIPAEKGTVSIQTGEKDGYYYIVDIQVVGIPYIQLYFIHPEIAHDDNMARPDSSGGTNPYFKCRECERVYLTRPGLTCPNCRGGLSYIPGRPGFI